MKAGSLKNLVVVNQVQENEEDLVPSGLVTQKEEKLVGL